jgi:hypothetical protein
MTRLGGDAGPVRGACGPRPDDQGSGVPAPERVSPKA